MKSLLLIGGFLGFACGFTFSFIHKEAWLACLGHGGMAGLLAGMLLAWWNWAWTDAMSESQDTSDTLLSTSTPKTSRS